MPDKALGSQLRLLHIDMTGIDMKTRIIVHYSSILGRIYREFLIHIYLQSL